MSEVTEVGTEAPKKRRGRPAGTKSATGDTKAPKEPQTVEDIEASAAKAQDKLAKLQAQLAIKKNPGLENAITSVMNVLREAKKAEEAVQGGAEVNVEARKAALQKQIEFYQNKINAAKEQIANSNGDTIIKQLGEARETAFANLATAYKTLSVDFTNANTTMEAVIPEIVHFKAEIDKRNA